MFFKGFKNKKEGDLLQAYHRLEEKAEDVWEDLSRKKKREEERIFLRKIIRVLFYGLLGLVLAVVLLGAFVFNSVWSIYTGTISGKQSLEEAVEHIRSQRFHQAAVAAAGSHQDLLSSYQYLEEWNDNFLVSHFEPVHERSLQLQHLLRAGILLSRSIEKGGKIGSEMKRTFPADSLDFNSLPEEQKREFLRLIYENSSTFKGVEGELELAQMSLTRAQEKASFFFVEEGIIKGRKKLMEAISTVKRLLPLTEILPALAGYPDRSDLLIALQNPDELRPAGGFLGTYGIAQIRNGVFQKLETHDIYHMDMPVQDKMEVEPPAPIAKYLNNEWFMRDSNWSPDWPTSARKIKWFYHQENALLTGDNRINDFTGEFEGVVGITPKFITDLLAITGPVTVEGVQYDQHNFTRLLEYEVEKGYVQKGVPAWHRKEVIGDIMRKIKIKLLDIPSSRWGEIVEAIDRKSVV